MIEATLFPPGIGGYWREIHRLVARLEDVFDMGDHEPRGVRQGGGKNLPTTDAHQFLLAFGFRESQSLGYGATPRPGLGS